MEPFLITVTKSSNVLQYGVLFSLSPILAKIALPAGLHNLNALGYLNMVAPDYRLQYTGGRYQRNSVVTVTPSHLPMPTQSGPLLPNTTILKHTNTAIHTLRYLCDRLNRLDNVLQYGVYSNPYTGVEPIWHLR